MAKKMKDLISAAQELNDVLGLEPEIEVEDVSEEELIASVKEGAGQVDLENDELSKKTLDTLRDYEIPVGELTLDPKNEDDEEEEKTKSKGKVKEEKPAAKGNKPTEKKEVEGEEDDEEEEKLKSKKKTKSTPAPVKEKEKKPSPKNAEKTQLGHVVGSKGAQIDVVLLSSKKALSLEDIAEKSGCDVSRVKSHLKHLEQNYTFEKKDGKFLIKL